MKLKYLIIIIVCFILNILLVNSQETKCPPDCSSSSKITGTSYLDSNSYNDKKFYENSDPKKWNFNDPNFDYSKIPLAKYKELPYTNPDVDHSRLDPNKYVSAFGCSTCTFRIATTQKIQYSTDGVFHTKTGLARIPGNYPPNTLFIATNEGIFIGLPKIDEKSKLDISNVGSATLITNNQKVTLSNGLTIDGRLSFKDNQAFVSKNDELVLEGIKIKPKGNDVFVYFDGKEHQGNYISYGQKSLVAGGNNFELEFSTDNKLVKMFPSKHKLKELAQDDYLYFSIGDSKSKNGKIELTNKDERNLLPLLRVNKDLETNGYVRMWNDRNDLVIDGSKVTHNYYSTYLDYFARYTDYFTRHEGAVSMQMVVGNDKEKIYIFDENKRILALNSNQKYIDPISEQPTEKNLLGFMDELREKIGKHNVVLRGFFEVGDLESFDYSLPLIEEKLGIDFSKIEGIKGMKTEIHEVEKRLSRAFSATGYVVVSSEDPQLFWNPTYYKGDSYRVSDYQYAGRVGSGTTLVHEMGHLLRNPELDEKFIKTGKEVGINFEILPGHDLVFGPEELFPSKKSKQDIFEFEAEIFDEIVRNPSWFEELTPAEKEKAEKEKNLDYFYIKEIIKARQAFGDIWLEELKKYKKDNK